MTSSFALSPTVMRRDSVSSSSTDSNETVLGAHVLGEYSAEIIQVVVACMAADMKVEQIAELPFAFPTYTEGITMAAQKVCSKLNIGDFPPVWSYLGPND